MTRKKTSEKTRSRILTLLKQSGPQEAGMLAGQINVTDMAIRQHLYVLEEQGDIAHSLVPRPKGRPAKIWRLTEQANAHFPDAHAEFSTGLISSVKQVFGDQGMEKLLDVRFRDQVADYSGQISTSTPLAEKLAILAAIRTAEGYMADILATPDKDEYLFVENNCPVCLAAQACSGICDRELDLFRQVLGPAVDIKRSEHIIHGARRCAYEISPTK